MQILADRIIANAKEAFSVFGEVTLFEGRDLNPSMLKRADVLLIRSVTKVDATFLASTPVKFVGTATAGMDHVDVDSLEQAKITFASAPGCNANAVAEFIATSVVTFCVRENLRAESTQVAIIGHGAVGSRVEHKLVSLGFGCLLTDPFKAQENNGNDYVSLDAALGADIVTLHAPLTTDGPYPTYRLIDAPQIDRMRNCRLLINAARGGIVNEVALMARVNSDPRFHAQLDCWENEPQINRDLIAQLFRASPHVAGHSIEARQNATSMLVGALLKWCRAEPSLSKPSQQYADVDNMGLGEGGEIQDNFSALAHLLTQCCPINDINDAMLDLSRLSEGKAGAEFDRLRRQFAGRREFTAYQVPIEVSSRFAHNSLQELGFQVR